MSRRWPYLLAAALIIPAGLGVRRVGLPGGLDGPLGDALWSCELYCVLRALHPRAPAERTAVLCLLLSFADEASQAIHTPWLDAIRATTLGHLLLGRGFVWLDLVWYTLGTGAALMVDRALSRRAPRGLSAGGDAPR